MRAKLWPDYLLAVMLITLSIGCLRTAADTDFYTKHCSGRSAWLCELAQAFKSHEVLGVNPVMLAFSTVLLAFLTLPAKRIWTGIAARIDNDEIVVPRFYSTGRMKLSEFERFDTSHKLMGLVKLMVVYDKAGRSLTIGNAVGDDLSELALKLSSTRSAPPAIPPAT